LQNASFVIPTHPGSSELASFKSLIINARKRWGILMDQTDYPRVFLPFLDAMIIAVNMSIIPMS